MPRTSTIFVILAMTGLIPGATAAAPPSGTLRSGAFRLELSADGGRILVESAGDAPVVRFPSGPAIANHGKEAAVVRAEMTKAAPSFLEARVIWDDGTRGDLRIESEGASGFRFHYTAPGAESIRQDLCDDGARYYGLWENDFDRKLDLAGSELPMFSRKPGLGSTTVNARAPFFFTSRGWGVALDSTGNARYRLGGGARTSFIHPGPSLEFRLFLGSPKQILRQYSAVSGKARAVPDWALKPIFWRNDATKELRGARNAQANVIRDAETLSRLGIAAGAMMIDRPYGSGSFGWGNYDFNVRHFPDPAGMIRSLRARGLVTMLWIANRASGSSYHEGRRRSLLFPGKRKDMPAIDLSAPEGRRWWTEKLSKLVRLGVRGFKIDRGDEGELPDELANIHAVLIPETAAGALRAEWGEDFLLISRNAFDRARTATALWNGDPDASFAGLEQSVRHGIRAGLINFPLWGSDTGGFSGVPDRELLARWIEFSALSPIMEILIDHEHKVLWDDFGTETIDVLRKYTALREELHCYIKKELAKSIEAGLPLMRALLIEFPDDPEVADLADEYLFGDSLLVAPVLRKGARERKLYLPHGRWTRYPGGTEALVGGRWISAPAALDELPLFVRDGYTIIRCPGVPPASKSGASKREG